MADCSEQRSPLQRQGTARGQRALAALRPESVELIDKRPEDWIVWASGFSARIRFFDEEDHPSGSFEPLFGVDIAARLATITTHPADTLPLFSRGHLTVLHDTSVQASSLSASYTALYDMLFSYVHIVDRQYRMAVRERDALLRRTDVETGATLRAPVEEFCAQLAEHITKRLRPMFEAAAAYEKDASGKGLLAEQGIPDLRVFHAPMTARSTMIDAGLSDVWGSEKKPLRDWYDNLAPTDTIHVPAATDEEAIQRAARHHFFTGLLDEASASSVFIMSLARRSMGTVLSDWPQHQPQYALFLAWLKLMEEARGAVNGLVGKHLDFYYGDVLRLHPAAGSPDTVYPTLELNKAIGSYALKAGTVFNAGKDADGKPVHFEATREAVLGHARLAQVKSVYTTAEHTGGAFPRVRMYASPIANSADGIGAEPESALKEWHPFAATAVSEGVSSILMPDAAPGLAIASRYLLLAEGRRVVTIRLNVGSDPGPLTKLGTLGVQLTHPKGWLDVVATLTPGSMHASAQPAAVLTVDMAGDLPSITRYDSGVHGHSFGTEDPVLMILFPPDGGIPDQLAALSALRIEAVEIEVSVGEKIDEYDNSGLRNFEAHNDAGRVNPAKPFMPWGVEPTTGSALIVGCEELSRKPGAELQFNFLWKDLPLNAADMRYDSGESMLAASGFDIGAIEGMIGGLKGNVVGSFAELPGVQPIPPSPPVKKFSFPEYYPLVDIHSLDGGAWKTVGSSRHVFGLTASLQPKADVACSVPDEIDGAFFLDEDEDFQPYSPAATKGFFRIQLRKDFGFKAYRAAHIKYLIDGAKADPAPVEPYQPVLQALHLSYRARASAATLLKGESASDVPIRLFAVGPFGEAALYRESASDGARLLPELAQFTAPVPETQGELYLGFEKLQPGESLSLLFQLLEGSENPLREKPEEHVSWWCLASDSWLELSDEVNDGTKQLIRSGIVTIAIPKAASMANTLLPSGVLWLKLKVTEAADAVCKIIGIHTNAVEAKRSLLPLQSGSTPFLSAGTIAKLRTPVAEVRRVSQPYTSFGGSAVESPGDHRQRVSERLRHKDRAITIWDYERLVMQAFPEIYRVKCLNHTRISGSADDGTLVYNEVAPGYVTIITIPQLQNRNDADPLRPYTKAATLESIASYLGQRISCHVRLDTAQPQFEEVRVQCRMVLLKGYDDTVYYAEQLRQDVTAFLSPWAFGAAAPLDFGGSLHKSVIIDFIEELPYVDVITDVKLFHKAGETAVESGDLDEVIASTARSILVSAHASKHAVTVELPSTVSAIPEHCDE
jgi:hypothetical protein